MVRTFADKKTRLIWENKRTSFDAKIQRKAFNQLQMLDSAKDINDLKIPTSNRLEKLSTGFWSIRVNNQYRITFFFENGDAYQVKFYDYHK